VTDYEEIEPFTPHRYLVIDAASTWGRNLNITVLQVEVDVVEATYSPISAIFGHGSECNFNFLVLHHIDELMSQTYTVGKLMS
jgi:hypothetical protein